MLVVGGDSDNGGLHYLHLNYCHLLILTNKVVENENLDNSPGLHSNLPVRG